MEINGEGPKLAGVYGRKAGSVPGFDYSQGLKNSGLTWNDATLEKRLSGQDFGSAGCQDGLLCTQGCGAAGSHCLLQAMKSKMSK
jgi:hypothetical protein